MAEGEGLKAKGNRTWKSYRFYINKGIRLFGLSVPPFAIRPLPFAINPMSQKSLLRTIFKSNMVDICYTLHRYFPTLRFNLFSYEKKN